jgi:hypothetical protein
MDTHKNPERNGKSMELAGAELDDLLVVGEADIDRGDVYDGDQIFDELDKLSTDRRNARAK